VLSQVDDANILVINVQQMEVLCSNGFSDVQIQQNISKDMFKVTPEAVSGPLSGRLMESGLVVFCSLGHPAVDAYTGNNKTRGRIQYTCINTSAKKSSRPDYGNTA
jgi:hypothetical protein